MGREGERGRDISHLPLTYTPHMGTGPAAQACVRPEIKPPLPLRCDTQPTEPQWSGLFSP